MNRKLYLTYWLVVALLLLSLFGATRTGINLWQQKEINQYIEIENKGETQPPSHYKALFSKAFELVSNEQLDQALDILTQIISRKDINDDKRVKASSYFNRANIHLRQAQLLVAKDPQRIPLVELAKQDYRTALLIYPASWDIRFNLEVALRMVPEEPDIEGVFEQPKISSEKSIQSVGFRVDLP